MSQNQLLDYIDAYIKAETMELKKTKLKYTDEDIANMKNTALRGYIKKKLKTKQLLKSMIVKNLKPMANVL